MSTAEIIAELPRLNPAELARVQAKVIELVALPRADALVVEAIATHPALGIWKDRTDLPQDPALASERLREHLMRRADKADS